MFLAMYIRFAMILSEFSWVNGAADPLTVFLHHCMLYKNRKRGMPCEAIRDQPGLEGTGGHVRKGALLSAAVLPFYAGAVAAAGP